MTPSQLTRRFFVNAVGAMIADVLAGTSPPNPVTPSVPGNAGVPPEAFGADGTVAGDSAGLRAAISASSGAIDLKPRTYLMDASALSNIALSGRALRGVKGQTKIQLTADPSADFLYALKATDFAIEDIIFDANGFLTGTSGAYGGYQCALYLAQPTRFRVRGCQVLNFHSYGIFANVASQGRVEQNYVAKPDPSGAYANYAIGIGGGGGAALSADISVEGNTCVGSDVTINATRAWVMRNDISGWNYSAGINVAEAAASSGDLIIALNHVHDPAATPDTFNFYLDCIECWAANAIIALNNCHGSIGNGISFGGPNSIVANNACYNNGSVESGQSGPAGWGIRALSDTLNASGSLIIGNRCFDNRASGLQMQQYGYGENSTSFTGIKLWDNDFDGNGTADLDVRSAATVVDGAQPRSRRN